MAVHAPADLAEVLVRFIKIRSLAVTFHLIRVHTAAAQRLQHTGFVFKTSRLECVSIRYGQSSGRNRVNHVFI
jgi:hypothetical protein